MAVISVSLPDELVASMDAAIAREGASGRSAWMRAAMRARLEPQIAGGHVHGSITVAYPHGNEARVSEARHAHHDVVLSMMHTHCDPAQCMDVLLVGGEAARVLALHRDLEQMRAVDRAVFVPVTTPTADADAGAP